MTRCTFCWMASVACVAVLHRVPGCTWMYTCWEDGAHVRSGTPMVPSSTIHSLVGTRSGSMGRPKMMWNSVHTHRIDERLEDRSSLGFCTKCSMGHAAFLESTSKSDQESGPYFVLLRFGCVIRNVNESLIIIRYIVYNNATSRLHYPRHSIQTTVWSSHWVHSMEEPHSNLGNTTIESVWKFLASVSQLATRKTRSHKA